MKERKRYALVGTGGRCVMFVDAILGDYKLHSQLVAMCDLSRTRMDFYNREIKQRYGAEPLPTYLPEDFDKMVRETRPDVVIITSMDATHHRYIIRAMELGCDAICEKPMTIDAEKAQAIFQAIERTGRSLRVTFNYRYTPAVTKVKDLLMKEVVGKSLAVDFSWVLDTSHGADYFRRWHRRKENSGGLLVHKASHHFDLINWWLETSPRTVFAMGDLKFYGRDNAEARGEKYNYERYTGVPAAANDPFAFTLDSNDRTRALYLEAEKDSGYIRDRNVFNDDINIEDTMVLAVRYRNGVLMNYSLLAYSPWEGFRVAITGTKGRLEFYDKHGSHIITGQSDKELAAAQARGNEQSIKVFPMFGVPYQVEVPKAEGGHGGGDRILLEEIFSPAPPPDPFRRRASHIDGAASILVGISANQSMASGLPVDCDKLLKI